MDLSYYIQSDSLYKSSVMNNQLCNHSVSKSKQNGDLYTQAVVFVSGSFQSNNTHRAVPFSNVCAVKRKQK